jgi:alpha-1,3-mannosyltransferase
VSRSTLNPVHLTVRAFILLSSHDADSSGRTVVWCWGWDGAGDLDGPDVDPVWEEVPEKSKSAHAVEIKHDRSFKKH